MKKKTTKKYNKKIQQKKNEHILNYYNTIFKHLMPGHWMFVSHERNFAIKHPFFHISA